MGRENVHSHRTGHVSVVAWGGRGGHRCISEISLDYRGADFWENALVVEVNHELGIWGFRYCARRSKAPSDAYPRRRASALRKDGVEQDASGFVLWASRDTATRR